MVNLNKESSSLVVTSDQAFPWESGKISLPMNSLYFVIDESDAIVFRSVANSDIIFNALLKDLTINGTPATKDNLVELFDSVGNAIPSGGGTGGTITVDSVLSPISENPVQNKVITNEMGKKLEVIEITQAEYDALKVKEHNVMYVITDAPDIDITVDNTLNLDSKNPVENKVITAELNKKVESVQLTQKEYDELVDKDPKIMYIITDAPRIEDNVFDATPLFEASQKPQDKTVSEAFQTAILAAISEKKVMVIHNGEVNVVVTFAQKKDGSVMFTATNNMQYFYILLNTVTREVSIDMKAVGSGTFDKFNNEQNHSIFDLTVESTNNDIQVAFSTNENGVKVPQVGDVIEVKDIDDNITDSGIVISHVKTVDQIDLIIHSNNLVDDFEVSHHIKLNYNAAQGFDSLRIEKVTHNVINPALISDDKMQALNGKVANMVKISKLTQDEYNQLPTKDANTLYIITDVPV